MPVLRSERRPFGAKPALSPTATAFMVCRDVPGIHVWGDDEVEAFSTCKEAATVYIQAALKAGDPLPAGIARDENPTNPGIRRKSTTRKRVVQDPERALA